MTKTLKGKVRQTSGNFAVDYAIASTAPHPTAQQITLKAGLRVRLRRAEPADAAQLIRMHHRLSPMSRYYRYMRPYIPSHSEMEELGRLSPERGKPLSLKQLHPPRGLLA